MTADYDAGYRAALVEAAEAARGMHDPVAPDCAEWADWLEARATSVSSSVPPHLLIFARCPRCQTWVFTGDHSAAECEKWRALRADPSHECRWHVIGERAAQCLDCRSLGEIKYPEPTSVTPPGGPS